VAIEGQGEKPARAKRLLCIGHAPLSRRQQQAVVQFFGLVGPQRAV